MARPLFTIGYEQATPAAVLAELVGARVDLLVDVRAVTASRRPGFSKRQLAASLDESGISYLHLRALGTPTEGRAAARSGKLEELRRIFGAHMRTPPAREALDELTTLVRSGKRVCLLCYERDHTHCHRSQLAEMVSEQVHTTTENLIPRLY
jgi:uncharacterized protein (DUF488 family)